MRFLRIVSVLVTALLLACTSSDASLTPADLHIKYSGMRDAVEGYVNLDGKFVDGEWTEHWGDGSLFGPLYDLSASKVHSDCFIMSVQLRLWRRTVPVYLQRHPT